MVAIDDKLSFKKREAADILSIGLTKLDQLIASKEIRAVKSGHHTLLTREELKRYLASLPRAVLKDHSSPPEEKKRREARKGRAA